MTWKYTSAPLTCYTCSKRQEPPKRLLFHADAGSIGLIVICSDCIRQLVSTSAAAHRKVLKAVT